MSELVVVFGGSGFLGKYLVRALCKAGYRVRVAMRRPHLGHELRVMGVVGQVQLVQANVKNYESVARAMEGADIAINSVNIQVEKGKQKFNNVLNEGAQNIAKAAAENAVKKLIHISGIGAQNDIGSNYAKAKANAENAVISNFANATILRPSVIFGPEDYFYNKFAAIERITPLMPLIGGGQTKFQPVYADDVARAVMAAIKNDNAAGKIYELGGPNIYSFEEIMKYIVKETNRNRGFIKLPFGLMELLGGIYDFIFRFIPFMDPPFTGDQIKLMRNDNVVAADALGFKDLGISNLTSVEAIAPTYLYRFRPHGQFQSRVVG